DLAERATFLAVVDDNAELALLRGAGAFLDPVDQVGTAGADVRAEYVRAVALVVHPTGDPRQRIGKPTDIAGQIDRDAAHRRQEHAHVGARDELRINAGGLLEQGAPQIRLGRPEVLRDARQVPHRINRDLDD